MIPGGLVDKLQKRCQILDSSEDSAAQNENP